MSERSALKAALSLLHLPSSVRVVRSEPLPPGIETLLRIAAGDAAAELEAARLTERPRPVIREAAAFYVEQVLLSPSADSYRVLGATPAATSQELRRHMALLLSWLHPDKNTSGERAVLAARVTGAWNDLRSPDRRAAYDAALSSRFSSDRALRRHAPAQGSRPRSKIAASGNGHVHNAQTMNAMGKRSMAVALRGPAVRSPAGREAGLIPHPHRSLLRRGWQFLRRVLRDRSTP